MKNALSEKLDATTSKRLQGKVALVTGGSRGIGTGIALELAKAGASVAITYSKNEASAQNVLAQINELGVKGAAYQADVKSEEQTRKTIENIIKDFGKIDILVNNAGVFEGASLEQITAEHYNRVFDVNVLGVISTTVAALPKLSEGGRIISISSVAAKSSLAQFSVYSASKAALDTLTRVWAQELGPKKITVNAVAPGATYSDMLNAAMDEGTQHYMIEKTALKRLGQPDDIAAVVLFLASDEGRWVTGQTITADGGMQF